MAINPLSKNDVSALAQLLGRQSVHGQGAQAGRAKSNEADLAPILERTRVHRVHVEEHRMVGVDFRINVGSGKGVDGGLSAEAVAAAQNDPKLAELNAALSGFDALNSNQKNMIFSAGLFLKDRDEGGYAALVNFVDQAKAHAAAAGPDAAFSMEFSFKSESHLVVDYVEIMQERVALPPEGREGEESVRNAPREQSRVQARRTVFSLEIHQSGILLSLGPILADLKAGEDLTSAVEKPKEGNAALLDALLDPEELAELRAEKEKDEELKGKAAEKNVPQPQVPIYKAFGASAVVNEDPLKITVGYA
jgi:hypothetical protein